MGHFLGNAANLEGLLFISALKLACQQIGLAQHLEN